MYRGLGVCCSRWSLWYKGAATQFAVLIIHSDSELRTEISFKFPAKFNLLLILFFLNGLRKMNFCFRIWITGVSALRPSSPYSCLERNRLKEEDSNFRSNEGLKSWHWSKNHRTTQIGGGPWYIIRSNISHENGIQMTYSTLSNCTLIPYTSCFLFWTFFFFFK